MLFAFGSFDGYALFYGFWRSGTVKAANGEAVLPSVVTAGRIDSGGAVEVEVVGLSIIRERGRRPVVAVVTGVVVQAAGILADVAAPQEKRMWLIIGIRNNLVIKPAVTGFMNLVCTFYGLRVFHDLHVGRCGRNGVMDSGFDFGAVSC